MQIYFFPSCAESIIPCSLAEIQFGGRLNLISGSYSVPYVNLYWQAELVDQAQGSTQMSPYVDKRDRVNVVPPLQCQCDDNAIEVRPGALVSLSNGFTLSMEKVHHFLA